MYLQSKEGIKMISKILCIVSTLFILWGIFSFIEINMKNIDPNPNYSNINMFIVLENIKEME